ncbi:MAG: hypothetical protein ACUVQU_07550 [Candidatus Bipolaricaulia bacterium]
MALRRGSVALLLLLFCGMAVAMAAFFGPQAQAQAAELTVLVSTDKPEYQTGELVTITVRVLLDGVPVASRLELAYIDIAYDSGSSFRHYITWDFIPVATGVFVAQAKAGPAGLRQVYVAASATITEGCCCRTIYASGLTYFTVKPGCTCQPCYYYPCWCCQPCQPCPECRAPDFFLRYTITIVSDDPPVSFSLPDYVVTQLEQRAASPVTFREAPAHTVVWSSIPGFGWVNDALSELGLALDPETGRISGNVDFRWVRKDRYFFFIEALNPMGEVVAGIWVEIAFV